MAGTTVLITGAAGNLGRAVAEAFAARGANLALVARGREHLKKTFGDETDRRLFVTADLTDAQQAKKAAEQVEARFGRIDVLCNLAGGFRMGHPVHATSEADFKFLFDINLRT